MEDGNDDVTQWNTVNNELDKLLRAAGSAQVATEADRERIVRDEAERTDLARREFERLKAGLEAQVAVAVKQVNKTRAEVREQEKDLKETKISAREEMKRRGTLKAAIQQCHLDILLEDKNLVLAKKWAEEANAQLEEAERTATSVQDELRAVRDGVESNAKSVEGLETRKAVLEDQLNGLKDMDEELERREAELQQSQASTGEMKKRVAAEMNSRMRMALYEIDLETVKTLEVCRNNCLAVNSQRLSREGPDVEYLRDDIKKREDYIAEQQIELDRLQQEYRELHGQLGQAEALESEIERAKDAVQEAKAASQTALNARQKEIEKARIQYERERAKNDTSTTTDLLRLYRNKLQHSVAQLVVTLGCTEEDLVEGHGRQDEERARATMDIVDAATVAVFEDVSPRQHTFRVLSLKETSLSLDGWAVMVSVESGECARFDLDNVTLPPLASQLFYSNSPVGREDAVKVDFDRNIDWRQPGARLHLLDHNGNEVASVRLVGP